ncbi:MAG: TonB-dependent receptor [Proteobacteria bacterium]|nr:TonB-dependent receptor [Pseudomonadota bacterium]
MSCSRRRASLAVCAALAALTLAASPAAAQEALGAWHGVLVVGPTILRVVVHVKDDGKGGFSGDMVSLDQGGVKIPLSGVKAAGGHFSFAIPPLQASFDGQWDPVKSAWSGQFKQGVSLPLVLEKGEFPAAPPPAAAKPSPTAGKTVEGVTVTAQSQAAVTADIDRRSYDITKDLQAQTGSIADALRNIPSVQVDVQGNVSLRGDPSVTIMIDGKPSSLFKGPSAGQVLQNLPANAFERVEVMTNPSAAYRPDGSGGIINLIPKKVHQVGTSGSVRVTAGPDDKAQLNLNLSKVGPKLTLAGDAVWAHEKQNVTVSDQRSTLDPSSGNLLGATEQTGVGQTVDLGIGRASFDYDPDSRTRISGELRGTYIRADADTATSYQGLAPGGAAPLAFDRGGAQSVDRLNLAVNGSWRRKFGPDPDHELVVDLTQERNTEHQRRNDILTALTPGLASQVESISTENDGDQSHVKVDYTRPFADNAKLKTGYELEYDSSEFDNFGLTGPAAAALTPNPSLIDDFRIDQAINGVYATWQQPVGKLTMLGGLRLEDTEIDMKDPTTGFRGSNDYTRVYPSLHLAWKLDDATELRASYSERIARPLPSDYNPFRVYRDPFNFTAGNPDLKPQETQSFELGGQYRKGLTYILATFYYRDNEKGVTDVVTNLGDGVLLTTKQNLTRSRNGGLELVAAGRFWSKFSYQVRADGFHNEIDATALGFPGTRSAWTVSGGGSLTYQMTPKDQFQLIGQVTGKRLTPQGYHEPLGLLFGGYRHQFNKDWALSVSARDLLNSYRDTLVIDTPTLHDRAVTRVKLRAVFLQLTYSFGQGPRKDTGIDYGTATTGAAPR